jgi:predicted nuclease with TOPRIM domain
MERFNKLKPKKLNIEDLQFEVNQIKNEIKQLKGENNRLEDRVSILEINNKFNQQFINNQTNSSSEDEKPESPQRQAKSDSEFRYLNIINKITPQKWHTKVKIIINKK